MTAFFSLVEHRKAIQRRVIELSDTLHVIAMEQSNEDELRNQLRTLEAQKLGKTVNTLSTEAVTLQDEGREDEAAAKMTEATRLAQTGLDMMLQTLRTMICTEDGKKPTMAQLKSAIGSQDDCAAVLEAVAAARTVDPTKLSHGESTPR